MHQVQGGTTGSHPKLDGQGLPPVLDQQATVITHRAPMGTPSASDGAVRGGPDETSPVRLGNFELIEYVGGGGMGRVFRGFDTALARTVAVKVLAREQAVEGDVVARFRNEAQSAARLNHENIVQVYHVGEDDGLPYIVFEFIEGVNLRATVEQKGALPLAEAINYTLQIARALAHAAECSVVHRDIKPSNVLITKDDRVKLIDLGLARVHAPANAAGDLTASGVTLGTFDYISPEQARDPRTADVRSDIYSLGCTVFYMLTGRPPFPEGTVLQKLLQHQGERPPDVRQFRSDLPESVAQLVRRMMAKDPRRRFQTPAELIDALVLLADEVGLAPARLGMAGWAAPRRPRLWFLQRHVPWLAPLALLILMVLGLQFLPWPSSDLDGPLPLSLGQTEDATPRDAGPGNVTSPEKTKPEPTERSPAGPETPSSPAKADPAPAPMPKPGGEPASKVETPGAAKPSAPGTASIVPGKDAAAGNGGGSEVTPPKPIPASPGGSPALPAGPADGGPMPPPSTGPGGPSPSPDPSESGGAVGTPASSAASVLVVDGVGGKPGQYATLEAACRAAATNDVIELRYDGPKEERPLALGNVRLTIRAGRGFRPLVVFRPAGIDPVVYPRAMITLTGGHVALIGVPVELAIPRDIPADGWSLFELHQAETARLEKCTLTIRNASADLGAAHQNVAFFRVKAAPGSDPGISADSVALHTPGSPSGAAVTISLLDCIVRGEAVVLRVQHPRATQFTWTNGFLATSEQFLVADGRERALAIDDVLKVDLQHVTALVRGGLCRFVQTDSSPRQLPVQLSVSNSILIGSPSSPLIDQTGVSPAEAYRQRIVWSGERNFYEGFANFWDVQFAEAGTPPELMPFEAWQTHWGPEQEIRAAANRVQWKQLPASDRAVHTEGPGDYALSPASPAGPNPAMGAAPDGSDAGAVTDRLPEVPPLSPDK